MKYVDIVLFDMDGLMFDTERLRIEACNRVLGEMGFTIPEEILMGTVGLTGEDSKKVFIDNLGPKFNYDYFFQTRRKWISDYIDKNGMPIKKGLIELLSFLEENNIRKAIVTSNEHVRVEKYLAKSNLLDSFDEIITGEHVERRKPFPDIYLFASEKFKIIPSKCLVFEDSINGVQAACAANMKVIMVPDLIQPNSKLEGLHFIKCDTLLDAIEIIKEEVSLSI
jgi:HAD superfamily hydrolase (TIGR01509 family)